MRYIKLRIDDKNYTSDRVIDGMLEKYGFYWLVECEFDNADIEIKNDTLVWHNGIFYWGNWQFGIWKNGEWRSGNWLGGIWINGTWKNGTWHNGIWKNGNWINGTWKNGLGR